MQEGCGAGDSQEIRIRGQGYMCGSPLQLSNKNSTGMTEWGQLCFLASSTFIYLSGGYVMGKHLISG